MTSTAPELKPRQHYTLTLFALLVAAMAYALSQTLVTPALPVIQRELNTTTTMVTFTVTAFLLTASVATPIVGRLGDMFGKERMMVIVLGCFACGSMVSALAPSIHVLILGRAIQGVGGAIFPLAFGIIRDEFPREKVASAIGLISATFGIGGGLGVILSGVIVDNLSYHYVFWLGLLVVMFALVATHFWVPESPVKTPSRIDWVGAALLSLGLGTVLIAVSEGNRWGWLSPGIVWLFALGSAIICALIWFEPRHPQPLVDMKLLKQRPVLTPNIVGFLVGFGMFGSFILIPQMVQMPDSTGYGFGASVTQSGLFMLPSTGAMLIGGPLSGWLGGKIGSKTPLVFGCLMMMVSFVFMTFAHTAGWHIFVGTFLLGTGIGFAYAAMANLIIEAVPQTQTGAASGINTISRTIGGSLGGQIAASIIAGTVGASGFPGEAGFVAAFVMSAIGLAAAAAVSATIPNPRKKSALAPETVAVAPVAEPVPLAVPTQGARVVAGEIRASDGAQLGGVVVILIDEGGVVVSRTTTDIGGSFEFRTDGGQHTVVAVAEGCAPAAMAVTERRSQFDLVLQPRVPAF